MIFCIICCAFLGCNDDKTTANKPDVLAINMDTTVKPWDDFFLYANGGWIKNNKIPDEQSSWGIGNLVIEENLKRLRTINEDAAGKKGAPGSADQKIGDFWATAMDSSKIEKDGVKPLQPYFDKINSITDLPSLLNVAAEFDKIGVEAFFQGAVQQDDKNSDVMSFKLWQGGLGLPEREYYIKTDSSTINIRIAYLEHLRKILIMQGQDSAAARSAAGEILKMETRLAQSSRKLEDLRDPYTNYNKMAISDLARMNTRVDLKKFLADMGVKAIDSVIVGQPEFFKNLDQVVSTTPIEVFKNMLRFRLVSTYAFALPDTFGVESFNMEKLFTGAKVRKPRWKRVIRTEESAMGELLGQLYVKEFFNETAKKRYEDMVDAVRSVYKERIEKLDWMSDSTKQKAMVKLAGMKKKVGYPDKWKDFSALNIGRESYVQNMINANIFWTNYRLNKLGKPVDRDEWDMTPQTYNAYYNSSNNEIVLPAGIFTVPGYRDEEMDDAVVYGNAGASTIGHEITHGFDDEGRQYDEKGNLKSWWTKTDEEEFKKRAEFMVKQFNEYEPLPGLHVNGKASLGENIADMGGVLLGAEAFKKTEQYKKGEKIAGLTPMQRYFMGYALGWLGQIRDESLRNQLMTDVHAPGKYRVNGPFVNVPDFYTAFDIKPGSKMYRADSLRVRIW